jgi:pimeloyl-ACP methyl ester carboxylesterase
MSLVIILAVTVGLGPVPAQAQGRLPIIFIPGLAGTQLVNRNGEVWPNAIALGLSGDDAFLNVLALAADGRTPAQPANPDYTSVRTGDVLRTVIGVDVYQGALDYLGSRGYRESDRSLTVFRYDWRVDVRVAADRLDALITEVKAATGASRVNLLAHSMGGLVTRAYLADPARAANVNAVVSLGTPYFGTPQTWAILHYRNGPCFFEVFGFFCATNPATLYTLAQNFSGIYQLLPSDAYFGPYPGGYFNLDRDVNGDRRNEGRLTAAQMRSFIAANHNATLSASSFAWHAANDGFVDGGINGVPVTVVVGQGQGTIGDIREYVRRPWWNLFRPILSYDLTEINGDGTVVLGSANLGQGTPGDRSGGARVLYADREHLALAQPGAGSVLAAAVDALEGRVLTAGEGSEVAFESQALSGVQVLLNGVALLEASSAAGEITAQADGTFTDTWAGAGASRFETATSLFMPAVGSISVRLATSVDVPAEIRVRSVQNDAVSRMIMYRDLPQNGVLTLSLQDGIPALNLNGVALSPYSDLAAPASADITAPTSTVSIMGDRVTIMANDEGGSGVGRVEYSLDSGATVLVYTGPFEVPAGLSTDLYVKAIDLAGNEQAELTIARIGDWRILLPSLGR